MSRRNTVQRSLVLETVKELRCHANADEVYMAIIKDHPDISRGTVYRNLKLLSDIGEIRKVEMPCGACRYDHVCREHYHARCVKCGRVFDMEMEYMADLERSIKNAQGFAFLGHDIIFKGICLECNKKLSKGEELCEVSPH